MTGRLVRAVVPDGTKVRLRVDGRAVEAEAGDSVLVAVLMIRGALRTHEFGDGPRAGFCLMGACQDCWMWLADGGRVRACTTPAADGMEVLSEAPAGYPRHG